MMMVVDRYNDYIVTNQNSMFRTHPGAVQITKTVLDLLVLVNQGGP